jgi:hypothetical protein
VSPKTRNRARADGGIIDVQASAANTITIALTGSPAADSYFGCTSTATQAFRLVQELEVTCSDPTASTVALALDSTLAGYVRSVRRAGASVRVAGVSLAPLSGGAPPLSLVHPPLSASGTDGKLCNQHLPPVQAPMMPLGRYVLTADLVLDTTASGICNAHAVADFSPDTSLPAEWVRMRDPFQGASKKSFGFNVVLTAGPPTAGTGSAAAPLPSRSTRPIALVPDPPRFEAQRGAVSRAGR